jgi:hypothetical protein
MRAIMGLALALLGSATAAACPDDGASAAALAAKPAPRAAVASAGKLGAPLEIDYTVAGRPQPGGRFELELRIRPTGAVDALEFEANLDAGLLLDSGEAHAAWRRGSADAGDIARERLVIDALAQGLHYVHVVARARIGDRTYARTLAVPVAVGDATRAKAHDGVSVDAGGERIISLPAQE